MKRYGIVLFIFPFAVLSAISMSMFMLKFLPIMGIFGSIKIFIPSIFGPGLFFGIGTALYFRKVLGINVGTTYVIKTTLCYIVGYIVAFTISFLFPLVFWFGIPAGALIGTYLFIDTLGEVKKLEKTEKRLLLFVTVLLFAVEAALGLGMGDPLGQFGTINMLGEDDMILGAAGSSVANVTVLIWQLMVAIFIGRSMKSDEKII